MQSDFRHTPARPARAFGLDTLRALAILLVFAYHYEVFVSHAPTFGWFGEIGWVGVDLFFVLSGYLIANQIFGGIAQGSALSLKAFYARRLLRTLPTFYVVLALYFLFPAVMGGKTPPPLWTFLSFTQNLPQPGTAFSHAWSLCIEEQFYLVLPAAALIAARFARSVRLGWWLLGGLMLAAIVLRIVLWLRYGRVADGATDGYYPYIYYTTWCRFDELLPGVALAMLKNFHPQAWRRVLAHGRTTLVAEVAATALVFVLMQQSYQVDGYGYGYVATAFGYTLLACAFALLTLAALSPVSTLYRARVPGAAQLAAWSYAIYLTHKPLAGIVQRGLGTHGVSAESAGGVSLIALACLLGGWLLYQFVETPFMTLRDRIVPTPFPTLPVRTIGHPLPRSST